MDLTFNIDVESLEDEMYCDLADYFIKKSELRCNITKGTVWITLQNECDHDDWPPDERYQDLFPALKAECLDWTDYVLEYLAFAKEMPDPKNDQRAERLKQQTQGLIAHLSQCVEILRQITNQDGDQ